MAGDSPPPMIVQLRELLTDMQIHPETVRRLMHDDPQAYVLHVELCVGLVDGLIAAYPQLTEGWTR